MFINDGNEALYLFSWTSPSAECIALASSAPDANINFVSPVLSFAKIKPIFEESPLTEVTPVKIQISPSLATYP